jgi:cyclic dehypoxanthinyl futalosine synthase
MHIHPFSPAEIVFMAEKEKCSVSEVLQTLWDAGIRTIPGGGAEILTEPVRKVIAPRKATTDQWLDVCEKAHRIGFKTTATMMFGHVETDDDIIDHLLRLRDLQDRTAVYQLYPLVLQTGQTPLARQVKQPPIRPDTCESSPWPGWCWTISPTSSQFLVFGEHFGRSTGLLAGADDFGGVLVEEHVHKEAGHDRQATVDNVVTIIRRAGFTPARRDSFTAFRSLCPPVPPGRWDVRIVGMR